MRQSEFMMGGIGFKGLTASRIMEARVVAAHLETGWCEMARVMTEREFGSLPIVDVDNILLGIVTEYDLLKVLMQSDKVKGVSAKDIMTKGAICVSEETPVSEIVDIIETKHLIRLPVVKDGKLVGVVARRDILLAYINATKKPPTGL
jgi:CBS domain-containing protein